MNPAFPKINKEIRTVLRVYDDARLRNANLPECRDEMGACQYRLLTPADSFLPFQFARPSSVLGITSWKVYNLVGTELYDVTADASSITITAFEDYDYLTYEGQTLSVFMDEGYYYFEIVTDGNTYRSEDFFVPCQPYGDNELDAPTFGDGLQRDAAPDAPWYVYDYNAFFLNGSTNTAGNPTDPELAFEGSKVANFGDNLLYTYTGGAWGSSSPPNGTTWYNYGLGNFVQRVLGAWSSLVTDPVELSGSGAIWNATVDVAIAINVGSLSCTETIVQIEITGALITAGSVEVEVSGDVLGTVSANETYVFTAYVANGYELILRPTGFDGRITSVRVLCPLQLEDCFMRLSWTHCGNVGKTYYGTGMVQEIYLPQDTPLPVADPLEQFETEENDDGTLTTKFARKQTTYSLHIGFVPWFVADALSEVGMHDTVKLNVPVMTGNGDFNAAELTNVHVNVEQDLTVSECLRKVTLTFELDNTAVSCCEVFAPPCREACITAAGFDDGALANGNYYLLQGFPRYAFYTGGGFQPYSVCTSGVATIDAQGAEAYTVVWNPNTEAWEDIATNTLATVVVGPPCTVTLRWSIPLGYRGMLQYKDTGTDFVDDTDFDLSAEEWAANTTAREAPVDQHADNELRLRLYVDDGSAEGCEVGFSVVIDYTCA